MKHLYYCRHGESFVNIEDIFATKLGMAQDKGLTEKGKLQAQQTAERAKHTQFTCDLMISSPLRRARETAAIIADGINYPLTAIEVSPLVIEMQYGELEGTPWNAFWEAGNTYADLYKFSGAETIELMQARAEKALAYLQSLPQETVLVVSHSAFGRALKRVIAGQPPSDEFINGVSLPHGEILKLI